MAEVYFAREIEKILDKIDFSKLGRKVAIKVHFGERGCVTYINPEIVKKVYEEVVGSGRDATLVECNVLYRGSRIKTDEHIKTAREHGFDFAPIDILDSERGEEYVEIDLEKGFVSPVKIGKGLKKYDSMIVISHFKGHVATGFGGAIKNVGMGLGSRAGKLQMHSDLTPNIDREKCNGCNICIENCDFNAIKLVDGKAKINPEKCAGCAMCIAVCSYGAARIPWGSTSEELQEKIIDYVDGVFRLIPKEKIIFINVLENITKDCDCFSTVQKPIMKDVGVLMSDDIIAIDKASLDLVNSHSKGKFDKMRNINGLRAIDYGVEKGVGSKKYELKRLD